MKREAVELSDPTASGVFPLRPTIEKGWHMNSSERRHRKANPDADPTPAPDDQDDLPSAQDATHAEMVPYVQANGQAASNGRAGGHSEAVADRGESEADPYDLASLRLSQDFASAVGVKRLITTIPVRKPSKEWFVRTHPDSAYRHPIPVLELKEDREIYLVAASLWGELASELTFSPRLLVTAINRQGVLFLWLTLRP
jgi:hypothetical protein